MSDLNSLREQLAQDVQKLVQENAEETKQEGTTSQASSEGIENSQESIEASAPELTEIEKQAQAMGWKPQTEYQGEHFTSAEEYVRRAPLFERIEKQSREVKELRDLVKQSTLHLSEIKKQAYERAIKDLEASRTQQVELGNVDGFRQVDAQVNRLQQQMNTDPVVNYAPPTPEIMPEVSEFGERNKSWYNESSNENKKMVAAAKAVDHFLTQEAEIEGRQINPAQHLRAVETEVKRLFPHRFENIKKDMPATVGRSTSSERSTKQSALVGRLTAQQRDIGLKFQNSNPAYTLEVYAKDLEEMGRLGK